MLSNATAYLTLCCGDPNTCAHAVLFRFPELDDVFYALTVHDREQYFKTYDDGRSLGVSVTALGIIFIGLCVQQVIAPASASVHHACD